MTHSFAPPAFPSGQDSRLPKAARIALEAHEASGQSMRVEISGAAPVALDLPPLVTRVLMEALRQTEAGKAVSIHELDAEVTTQQAADLLNVSRPYLVGLVNKGVLPARMVGNQRRLLLKEVLANRGERFVKREQALDEMVTFSQEFGLYE